MKCRQRYRII